VIKIIPEIKNKTCSIGVYFMDKSEIAFSNMESRKMNCAQCVLTAYCEELGLSRPLAIKLAMGFGGGMGHTGQTCGAVTGAFMVLGLKQNLTANNAPEIKEKTYAQIKDFKEEFIKRNGSVSCTELVGYDLSQPGGLASAREKGVFISRCPKLVKDAVEIIDKIS
jgi:C_GCAxxG_C_C family probable redox protein